MQLVACVNIRASPDDSQCAVVYCLYSSLTQQLKFGTSHHIHIPLLEDAGRSGQGQQQVHCELEGMQRYSIPPRIHTAYARSLRESCFDG
ncbi:hypothetical protein CERZMDRAFT_91356 [Cercospora zeae-maydis SCOH1-5]|uniref:Uncharacterized protein n=1 Tax=Cercospora zeae-maydis SCOH1-5 TaxID=717836 RepID=A0A6A6F8P9_9PEZI|nr:hypothetical protein CERZMDRAFT_91356 [Cercospora zeae-maydis SCOH1-5]